MTYNRVLTPRAYMDRLSFDLATGQRTISNYTLTNDAASPGTVTPSSGVLEDLFDLRPSNFITVAVGTQAFRINIDTGASSDTVAETSFLAILGHNFEYADAVFKFEYSDNAVFATHTGTNVEFVTPSTDKAIHGTGGSDIFELFVVGNKVTVSGSTSNNGTFTILSKPDNDTLYVSESITDESAGDTVTVTTVTNVTTTGNHTKIINAAADSTAGYIDPANNGWTLISFTDPGTTGTNQYKRITIEDDDGATTNFSQPPQIGAILMGDLIDFPHSPDANLGFDIDYDGTKIVTSSGGSTFANTSYLGSPVWAKTNPWILAASASENIASKNSRAYGRRKYNMNFSYVADTNLFQSNMHAAHGAMIDGSDLYSQFYHKILGNHLPFLLSIDHDSTGEGDYGLFRLADGGLKSNQSAHRFWNTKLNLVEHW